MTSERTVNSVIAGLIVLGALSIIAGTSLIWCGKTGEGLGLLIGIGTTSASGLVGILASTSSDRREKQAAPVTETLTTTHEVTQGTEGTQAEGKK